MTSKHLLALLTCISLATVAGCSPAAWSEVGFSGASGGQASQTLVISGKTMGTTYQVKYVPGHSPDVANSTAPPSEAAIRYKVEQILQRVNDQMSTWQDASEISRFNATRNTDWFSVSKETAEVVALAKQISTDSGGAFDVTAGPLINLWNFGPTKSVKQIPTPEQITAAAANVGSNKVEVRLDPPALRKTVPRVYVDLSAIAKGHGVDRVADYLASLGGAFLVEVGGEVRTQGTKPDGSPWRLALEAPVAGERVIQQVIPLADDALASSGDYRNYYEIDGKRFSHTIDPRTGRPIEHSLAAVSVVTADCARADAVATALMVLGPEEGLQWAEDRQLTVVLSIRDGDNNIQRQATTAFSKRFGTPGE